LRDQRFVGDIADAADGGQHFVQVREGFQDESIDAAFQQRAGLFAENRSRFVDRCFSPGRISLQVEVLLPRSLSLAVQKWWRWKSRFGVSG